VNHHIEFVTRTPAGFAAVVTHTSVIDVQDVISDIRSNRATYSAGPSSWNRSPVKAVPFLDSAFLFANWDGTRRNNLHDVAVAPGGATGLAPGRDDAAPLLRRVRARLAAAARTLRPRGRREAARVRV
jgi:hypothetical protein